MKRQPHTPKPTGFMTNTILCSIAVCFVSFGVAFSIAKIQRWGDPFWIASAASLSISGLMIFSQFLTWRWMIVTAHRFEYGLYYEESEAAEDTQKEAAEDTQEPKMVRVTERRRTLLQWLPTSAEYESLEKLLFDENGKPTHAKISKRALADVDMKSIAGRSFAEMADGNGNTPYGQWVFEWKKKGFFNRSNTLTAEGIEFMRDYRPTV